MKIIDEYKALKEFPTFCDKLTQLLNSGVNIKQALVTIQKDEEDKKRQGQIKKIIYKLESGESFVSNLTYLLPNYFPFIFSQIPNPPDMASFITNLSKYIKTKLSNIRHLLLKISYPLFLLASVFIVMIIFIGFLLPSYQNFFSSFDIPTPSFLLWIIRAFGIIKQNFIILVLLGSIMFMLTTSRTVSFFKNFFYSYFFPYNIADILWLLSILMESGLDIKRGLGCINLPDNIPFKYNFSLFKKTFADSASFTQEFCKFFSLTSYQKQILINAEKTANMIEALQAVSQELKKQEQKKLESIINLAQPLLLFIIGIFVFCFIYFTFLPVLKSINNII